MDDEKRNQERDNVIDNLVSIVAILFGVVLIVLSSVEPNIYTSYLKKISITVLLASSFFSLGRDLLKDKVTILRKVATLIIFVYAIFY